MKSDYAFILLSFVFIMWTLIKIFKCYRIFRSLILTFRNLQSMWLKFGSLFYSGELWYFTWQVLVWCVVCAELDTFEHRLRSRLMLFPLVRLHPGALFLIHYFDIRLGIARGSRKRLVVVDGRALGRAIRLLAGVLWAGGLLLATLDEIHIQNTRLERLL